MPQNSELANAFPLNVRDDALIAVARFPDAGDRAFSYTFSVRVAGEMVTIPRGIGHDPVAIDTRPLRTCVDELDDLILRHGFTIGFAY